MTDLERTKEFLNSLDIEYKETFASNEYEIFFYEGMKNVRGWGDIIFKFNIDESFLSVGAYE